MQQVTRVLTEHYEACLATHGPTPQGMDWGPDPGRLTERFETICRAIGLAGCRRRISLLDVGCGCGLFLDHLRQRFPDRVEYVGLDASPAMIEAARERFPSARWVVADITTGADALPRCDWVVANGLLTERRQVAEAEMLAFAERAIASMYACCRDATIFNVLSTHVNHRDPMLFYWDPGAAIRFAAERLSRFTTVFHDLSGYEYYCCVRRRSWSERDDG